MEFIPNILVQRKPPNFRNAKIVYLFSLLLHFNFRLSFSSTVLIADKRLEFWIQFVCVAWWKESSIFISMNGVRETDKELRKYFFNKKNTNLSSMSILELKSAIITNFKYNQILWNYLSCKNHRETMEVLLFCRTKFKQFLYII